MLSVPVGTKDNSPGRKPWDCEPFTNKAPEGATEAPKPMTNHQVVPRRQNLCTGKIKTEVLQNQVIAN